MISRHTIRGRRAIYRNATADAVATLLMFSVLCARMHLHDFIDICIILFHIIPHSLSNIINVAVLHYTVSTSEPLNILRILYAVLGVIDTFALGAFAFRTLFHNHPDTPGADISYAVLRGLLAICFIIIDICGAYFADLAFAFIESISYPDNGENLYNTIRAVATSKSFTEAQTGGETTHAQISSLALSQRQSDKTLATTKQTK